MLNKLGLPNLDSFYVHISIKRIQGELLALRDSVLILCDLSCTHMGCLSRAPVSDCVAAAVDAVVR